MNFLRQTPGSRLVRVLIVLAGIVLGQAVLYGPSLAGARLLLPLDILSHPAIYDPIDPEKPAPYPHNLQFVDLVFNAEPNRMYLGSELRAGRFPLWNPYQFAGAPNILPKYSPFVLLGALIESPKILPWIEMLKAMVAGLGAYYFCRRVLRLAFWPAVIAGWCYPVTAFFVLWQEYFASVPVLWLPWLLTAVHRTVRSSSPYSVVGLALVTGMVLLSGQLDVAGQVLLTSGFFSLWCLGRARLRKKLGFGRLSRAVVLLSAGWGLGFLLAAPYMLPLLEYAQTGARTGRRSAGTEERPPVGIVVLPQVVLPKMYGTTEPGSFPIFPKGQGNLAESTAAAYTGLLATLLLAPLAWCSRRHRSLNFFWLGLAFFALSWCLNVPGLVNVLRLPGMNLMSHNRFVFATSFCILMLAVTGLDALWRGKVGWSRWFFVPVVLVAALLAWCAIRALMLPEAIETQLPMAVMAGSTFGWLEDLQGVKQLQTWYARTYAIETLRCAAVLAVWVVLMSGKLKVRGIFPLIGLLMMADLMWMGLGRATQSPPENYYRKIPALEQVAQAPPGRIMGYGCFPALLGLVYHFRDIRGYDAVDPARLMDLLMLTTNPVSKPFPYAMVQQMVPVTLSSAKEDLRLPPVLDMLNVRYLIFHGPSVDEARPAFKSPDYWVMVNHRALPRAYVPHRVEMVADHKERIRKLGLPDFDAREVAYVEVPVELSGLCLGSAEITNDEPSRVTLALNMQTPGLVVLGDLWDKGWHAYLNGHRAPILRANHALRGVVAPAGAGVLEFRYEPASFAVGLKLSALAAVVLLAWSGFPLWKRRVRPSSPPVPLQNPPIP